MGLRVKLKAGAKVQVSDETGEKVFELTATKAFGLELTSWEIAEMAKTRIDESRRNPQDKVVGAA